MVEIRRPKKSYEEHRREFAAARNLETSQYVKEEGAKFPAEKTSTEPSVAAPAPPAPPEAAPNSRRARLPQEEKLRLKFTVHAPIPGASAWFDQAVRHMGDDNALRLVLAKAFDELEAAVAAGEAVARGSYPIDPSRSANTSRHISAALFASGKGMLDPMELLPPGTFGRELAMAALGRLLRRAAE